MVGGEGDNRVLTDGVNGDDEDFGVGEDFFDEDFSVFGDLFEGGIDGDGVERDEVGSSQRLQDLLQYLVKNGND